MYETIYEAEYDDVDDIIDDIESKNECLIIRKISEKIKNNNNNGIIIDWTDEDDDKLHLILTKIYKEKITDINKFNDSLFEMNPFIQNPLIHKVTAIVQQLNHKMNKKIAIEKVKRLFNEDSQLTPMFIKSGESKIFEDKAKKYQIKPHHATKIFMKLREEIQDKHVK